MRKKRLLGIIAILLVVVTVAGIVLSLVLKPNKPGSDNEPDLNQLAVDELYVRDILGGTKVDDIIDDPDWEASLADATEDYITVGADKFEARPRRRSR